VKFPCVFLCLVLLCSAIPEGYLKVYSVNDEFNDGAYYAHSSYAIYSIDGRLFKRVENNISRTDNLIPWEVALRLRNMPFVKALQAVLMLQPSRRS
jgi:hypothetical protein